MQDIEFDTIRLDLLETVLLLLGQRVGRAVKATIRELTDAKTIDARIDVHVDIVTIRFGVNGR